MILYMLKNSHPIMPRSNMAACGYEPTTGMHVHGTITEVTGHNVYLYLPYSESMIRLQRDEIFEHKIGGVLCTS